MLEKLNGLDWLALIFVLIGGVNWGLIGMLNFNLVETVLGAGSVFAHIVYLCVGVASVYLFFVATHLIKRV